MTINQIINRRIFALSLFLICFLLATALFSCKGITSSGVTVTPFVGPLGEKCYSYSYGGQTVNAQCAL